MRTVFALSFMAIPLFAGAVLSFAAGPPDFSGKWVLDPSRSDNTNGETIQLTIQESPGTIVFDRVLREKHGKELHTSFTCANLGSPCDLLENGHKAKVSLWYDGAALMMAKTGGEKRDANMERRLEIAPDGKTMTVQFTNYSGSGKPQKLVFTKQ